MIHKLFYLLFLSGLVLFSSCENEGTTSQTETKENLEEYRIVSLSGFLTETLFDLGLGNQIVGRDVTSTYPAKAAELPNLGHVSKLNIEAILELNPSHIFIESAQLKQAESLKKLENSGVNLVEIATSRHLDNALKAARQIGKSLEIDVDKLDELAKTIDADSSKLAETVSQFSHKPSVLFIYARGMGTLMVGGENTSASAIIEKAGGINAMQSFENFRTLTPEALIEAAPEVILMFSSGLASLDGKEGLVQIPGIAQTPAFKNDRVIAMDGHYLTAFGSRVGKAAIELANRIHPE